MSKCWSRLEAASAYELNSSKNVKQFYRKECLSLACQGCFPLVFLVPFSTTLVSLYVPVSCPGWVETAEMLVLVCILLAGRYLSLLVGCEEMQTEPFLMARPQQSFVAAHGAQAVQTDGYTQ